MTTYEIRSRFIGNKRFHRNQITTDPKRAELITNNMKQYACYAQIKIIVTDDNGVKNELIIK